jgi:Protein of unknown function (DUF998)
MTRVAGIAAISGATLLSAVIIGLTLLQRDFLRTLGWDPVTAPTMDWPSGLSLGPVGALMTVTFLACGVLLTVFAVGMGRWLPTQQLPGLTALPLGMAALGMAGLAFQTDPTLTTTRATWHGRLHDLSFVLLGVGLALSWLVLGVGLARTGRWLPAAVCAVAMVVAAAGFTLKGPVFYAMLIVVVTWFAGAGLTLLRADPT